MDMAVQHFNFSTEPSVKALKPAKSKKPVVCGWIWNTKNDILLVALKQHFFKNKPVVFSADIFNSFVKLNKKYKIPLLTGNVPMPSPKDTLISGHCMCGYDDTKQHFIVQNLLSTLVGDFGYFYFPYKYIKQHGYKFFTFEYGEL